MVTYYAHRLDKPMAPEPVAAAVRPGLRMGAEVYSDDEEEEEEEDEDDEDRRNRVQWDNGPKEYVVDPQDIEDIMSGESI